MGLIVEESEMQTNNLELPGKRNNQQEQEPEHLECPRCGSSNTKFCYYNNYNKSQPRHFCKGCKRHWTKGGTLRTVPLGGCRKNKRQKISNSTNHKDISNVSTSTPISSIVPYVSMWDEFSFNANNTFFLASSQDQSSQFSCSGIGDFGSNLPLLVPKNQSFDAYGYTHMPDSSLESTITTIMPMSGCNSLSQKPWEDIFGNDPVDLSSLWDWNEINSLGSADLDVPWDDAEIKFQN